MIKQHIFIRFVYKAPFVIAMFMGCFYAIYMILNYRLDTTNVTNAGFAIMASLAAISFSFARVIESEELRDRIMFAGERLFHAALLILIASILKYFIFLILKLPYIANSNTFTNVLLNSVGLLTGLIFINGVLFAHTGMRILNDILLSRFTRQNDWDDIF